MSSTAFSCHRANADQLKSSGEFKLSISGKREFGIMPGTSGNSNTVFVKCSCTVVECKYSMNALAADLFWLEDKIHAPAGITIAPQPLSRYTFLTGLSPFSANTLKV